MKNVVLKDFKDGKDNDRLNEKGQTYPRESLEVAEEREQMLRDKGYIAKVAEQNADKDKEGEENEFPAHKGGGNFVLSNGETVKGKDAAIEAENNLKSGE